MDATYKKQRGFVLVTTMLVMSLLLLMLIYVVNFTITEMKISTSQTAASRTYYLAESGIAETIWKIKNDSTVRTAFLNGTLNSSNNIVRSSFFGNANSGYQIAMASTGLAQATIIATSTEQIGGHTSRRVVKVSVYKATGSPESSDWHLAFLAGGGTDPLNNDSGEVTFAGNNRIMTINNGRLHANKEAEISGNNNVVTVSNGQLTAGQQIEVEGNNSSFNLTNGSFQEAPTSTIAMPQMDFNSSAPTSLKNRATATYTYTQLKNLLGNNSTLTLTGIIYVSNGSTSSLIGNNVHLTINGLLVVDGNLFLTGNNSIITINSDSTYGGGLLVNGNITLGGNDSTQTYNGLVYASKKLDVGGNNTNYTINGGMICGWASIRHNNASFVINFDIVKIFPALEPTLNQTSPIVQIDHWEEQY